MQHACVPGAIRTIRRSGRNCWTPWNGTARSHPEHARSLIRNLFKQVHDHSVSLSNRIRLGADNPDSVAHAISHGTQSLRQNLAMLMQVLAARQIT